MKYLENHYVVSDSGCWVWVGSVCKDGYGKASVKHRSIRAHRLAYQTWVGEIPPGMVVCHSCDNPPCINPAHLWIGTPRDNDADRVAKGRTCRTNFPHRKLTDDQVREIRERLAKGERGRDLSAIFGVRESVISRIKHGTRWRSLL